MILNEYDKRTCNEKMIPTLYVWMIKDTCGCRKLVASPRCKIVSVSISSCISLMHIYVDIPDLRCCFYAVFNIIHVISVQQPLTVSAAAIKC